VFAFFLGPDCQQKTCALNSNILRVTSFLKEKRFPPSPKRRGGEGEEEEMLCLLLRPKNPELSIFFSYCQHAVRLGNITNWLEKGEIKDSVILEMKHGGKRCQPTQLVSKSKFRDGVLFSGIGKARVR
jgi:hypothetical protein